VADSIVHDAMNMPAQNIEAYTGIVKMLLTVNPIVGCVATVVGGAVVFFTRRNTKVTKANTETSESVTILLSEHKAQMEKIQGETLSTVTTFSQTVKEASESLTKEINNVKIVIVKLSTAADQKLSYIKTVEQAISQRMETLEAKNDILKADVNEAKSKSNEAINILKQMAETRKK
jgi:hypothetical protein